MSNNPISRSDILGCVSIIIGFFLALIPMRWWVKLILILIAFGTFLCIFIRFPFYVTSTRTYKIVYFSLALLGLIIVGWFIVNDQWVKDHPAPQGSLLSVSPSSLMINPGMNEGSKLAVTNNHDYPLFFVQIKITLDYGDIPIEDIIISPNGEKISQEQLNEKKKEPPRDGPKQNLVKIKVFNNNGVIEICQVFVKKKEGDIYTIFYIPEIKPHSTKIYPMMVDKGRCALSSKLSFEITSSCKNDVPHYLKDNKDSTGGMEVRYVLPKKGHYENCE